jgi:hypothetical protein
MEKKILQMHETEIFKLEDYNRIYKNLSDKFNMSFIPMIKTPTENLIKNYNVTDILPKYEPTTKIENFDHISFNRLYILKKYPYDIGILIITHCIWFGMTEEQLHDMILFYFSTHNSPKSWNNSLLMGGSLEKFCDGYRCAGCGFNRKTEIKMYNGKKGTIVLYGYSKAQGNYFKFINNQLKSYVLKSDRYFR